ncbi:Holin [Streptomyces sp. SDr-06]|uniref:holin n=1 Tax=Streptomyces sp. SDr-06 TaxID=2267702 RepID=UPI000DE9C082|nr:holin [Streptomyces sp. SDr-06]RCH68725.1 Holin [Streptomyces sp. SDr-06]
MNKSFVRDAGVRVTRTFVQTLVGALGLDGANVIHQGWPQALAVAGSAAVLSALTALASFTGSSASAAPEAPKVVAG